MNKGAPQPKKKTNVTTERDREHSFVVYPSQIDVLKFHLDELVKGDVVKKYAYIEHNNDVLKDGSKKPYHVHLYVYFNQPKSLTLGRELIKFDDTNVFSEFVLSTPKCVRYLCHLDDVDKYQYEINDVVSNFDVLKFLDVNVRSTANNNLVQCCIDLANGCSHLECLSRYGVDFIKNYHNILKISERLNWELHQKVDFNTVDMTTGEYTFEAFEKHFNPKNKIFD